MRHCCLIGSGRQQENLNLTAVKLHGDMRLHTYPKLQGCRNVAAKIFMAALAIVVQLRRAADILPLEIDRQLTHS